MVHNPRSRRNRESSDTLAAEGRRRLGPLFLTPSHKSELISGIQQFADQDIRCIAIDGGDGTISTVLSAIHAIYPADALPSVAVLSSGNSNLIAEDVGFGLRGRAALDRLEQRARAGTLLEGGAERRPIIVSWDDNSRQPVLGMFFGLAGFTRSIQLAHGPVILNWFPHGMAVLVTVLCSLAALLRRRTRQLWLDGTQLSVKVDDQAEETGRRFLVVCTTLQRLSHGIWPFWRNATAQTAHVAQEDGIAYLDMLASPPKLLRSVRAMLRGQSPAWLRRMPAYRSDVARSITFGVTERFVLDGEEFEPGPEGRITLSAGPKIMFLRA